MHFLIYEVKWIEWNHLKIIIFAFKVIDFVIMKKIVFATNNQHKLEEVRAVLKKHIEVISLSEIGCSDDIPETGNTLEENAILKANYVKKKFGVECMADDTGLEVEALNGEPGVFSARYAGEGHNSVDNMEKLLENLSGVSNRNARFRTIIALTENEKIHCFEGIVEGEIITEPKGKAGFGYDPVFVPKGYNITFAEMGSEEKNKISHRALAVKKLVEFFNSRG